MKEIVVVVKDVVELPEKEKCHCQEDDYLENGCNCHSPSVNETIDQISNLPINIDKIVERISDDKITIVLWNHIKDTTLAKDLNGRVDLYPLARALKANFKEILTGGGR